MSVEKKYDDCCLPISIINLKKDKLKRIKMAKQCSGKNIDFEYVEGVNGFSLFTIENCQLSKMTPGELGCALSHRKIYQTIAEKEIPWSDSGR